MFKITIISVGQKMPAWVSEAVAEYTKRLQEFTELKWVEVPLTHRPKHCDLQKIMDKERQLIDRAIPKGAYIVALAIDGKTFSSEELAKNLGKLALITSHLCLIIGGPEGLTEHTLSQANERWSLSALTLPHPLVRVILAEALYRAHAINANHPYHK